MSPIKHCNVTVYAWVGPIFEPRPDTSSRSRIRQKIYMKVNTRTSL